MNALNPDEFDSVFSPRPARPVAADVTVWHPLEGVGVVRDVSNDYATVVWDRGAVGLLPTGALTAISRLPVDGRPVSGLVPPDRGHSGKVIFGGLVIAVIVIAALTILALSLIPSAGEPASASLSAWDSIGGHSDAWSLVRQGAASGAALAGVSF